MFTQRILELKIGTNSNDEQVVGYGDLSIAFIIPGRVYTVKETWYVTGTRFPFEIPVGSYAVAKPANSIPDDFKNGTVWSGAIAFIRIATSCEEANNVFSVSEPESAARALQIWPGDLSIKKLLGLATVELGRMSASKPDIIGNSANVKEVFATRPKAFPVWFESYDSLYFQRLNSESQVNDMCRDAQSDIQSDPEIWMGTGGWLKT